MVSFRSIWIGIKICLSIVPVLSVFPLLGFVGGTMKLVTAMIAGPLVGLHSALLVGYGSLNMMGLASYSQVRIPAIISVTVCLALVLPPILAMISSPFPIIQNSPTEFQFSFRKWSSPMSQCSLSKILDVENITTIYRRIPGIGPASRNPMHLNLLTAKVWDTMFSHIADSKTELKTFFFPPPSNIHNSSGVTKFPLMIFIHGGGWWTGEPTTAFGCHFEQARAIGWATATLDYRLGRDGWSGDHQIDDVKQAVRHLISKHNVDKSRVIMVGSSAGAHLALLAAYIINNEAEAQIIKGVVAASPFTSVNIGKEKGLTGWTGAWNEIMATERLCEGVHNCHHALSPIEHVTRHSPKTIILHSGSDEFYTVQHSRALKNKLEQLAVEHVYFEPPIVPHSIEIVEGTAPTQMLRHVMDRLMKDL